MDTKDILRSKLSERVKEASVWSKLRSAWSGLQKASPTAASALKTTAIVGGVGALLGAGSAGASALIQAAKDPIKKRLGKNRMYRENEWLRHEDNKTVDKFYNTLYRFSPTMAMDPLVSGSFMKRQLEYKDVGVQPSDVSTMVNIEKAVGDARGDTILSRAFSPEKLKPQSLPIDPVEAVHDPGGYSSRMYGR
jgi:hypothetical protein